MIYGEHFDRIPDIFYSKTLICHSMYSICINNYRKQKDLLRIGRASVCIHAPGAAGSFPGLIQGSML